MDLGVRIWAYNGGLKVFWHVIVDGVHHVGSVQGQPREWAVFGVGDCGNGMLRFDPGKHRSKAVFDASITRGSEGGLSLSGSGSHLDQQRRGENMMKTTQLGPDGPKVSQFGLGAMSFAGIYGNATVEESHAVLDACLAAGVSHIDTSNVYGMGRSEDIIGAWLAKTSGARDAMNLATKAGITGQAERRFNNDPDYLERCLDESLQRLGVDHVDLFYVHRYDKAHTPEELGGTLKRIIETGKARAVGLSEIAPSTLRRVSTECPIAAVQSEYSLSTRAPELGLSQACAALGTTLVAFSPVGRSLLTDAPFSFERCQSHPFLENNPRFVQPNYDANIAATDRLRRLAADMGEPAAALAIAWTIAQGSHVLPIPGTKNVAHLAELVRGVEMDLTAEDLARIEDALPVGWAHGDRYTLTQWEGPERYC